MVLRALSGDRYAEVGLLTSERIGWMLSSAAERWGEREFLCYEDARYSFGDLSNWVAAAAHELLRLGIRSGDRAVLQLGNSVELLVLQFAAWRIGVVVVPVVPIYRAHELQAIIASTKPTLIAASRVFGSRKPYLEVEDILDTGIHRPLVRILVGEGEPVAEWQPCPPRPAMPVSESGLPPPAPAEDCCTILFSSGTTSAPKGVQINSRGQLCALMTWRHALGVSSRDTAVTGAPLTHVGALSSCLLLPLSVGARTVILSHWDSARAVSLIERERATYMAGATIFLHDLVERYENGESPGYRLQAFVSGGAPTPPSLVERAQALGIRASRSYGMTETCGSVTVSDTAASLHKRAHTEGRVAFGAEIEIVDDDRRPLSCGQPGNIRLRSPQLMLGYSDPALNVTQIDDAGWFYPGDVGSLSADGWLTMSGRAKDIINRGGEKFSSQDIEEVLVQFPPILDAAIVGLPDDRFGEVVCACLILRNGVNWSGPEPVLAHLDACNLARQKFPVRWLLLDAFPRTASGKVQKGELLKIALSQSGNRVLDSGVR